MTWRITIIVLLFLGGFLFNPVYAAANVTFDSQGTWIIDGQRWFLYGTHQVPRPGGASMLDPQYWDRMVNVYHVNNVVPGASIRYDNLAEEYGVYLIQGTPWIPHYYDNPGTPEPNDGWWNPTSKAEIHDQMSRPNRFLFYAAEEASIARDNLFMGYDYLKETYPNVPAHLNFVNISLNPFHTNLVNFITRTKAAVISSHRNDNTTNAAQTRTLVQLREEIPTVKSTYLLIRGWGEYGGGGTDPNIGFDEAQMEFDVFNSIVLGINGIRFWEFDATTPHYGGKYGEVIARVGGYLEEITPGLVAPNRIYKADHIISKGEDNRYYVIATPNSTSSFTVTGLPKNTVFERLFYGTGTITTNANGQFTDTTGGKIKIYRQKVAPSTPIPIPGDITETGDKIGDHVNINDYNLLVTQFGIPYNIFDYNLIVGNWAK